MLWCRPQSAIAHFGGGFQRATSDEIRPAGFDQWSNSCFGFRLRPYLSSDDGLAALLKTWGGEGGRCCMRLSVAAAAGRWRRPSDSRTAGGNDALARGCSQWRHRHRKGADHGGGGRQSRRQGACAASATPPPSLSPCTHALPFPRRAPSERRLARSRRCRPAALPRIPSVRAHHPEPTAPTSTPHTLPPAPHALQRLPPPPHPTPTPSRRGMAVSGRGVGCGATWMGGVVRGR